MCTAALTLNAQRKAQIHSGTSLINTTHVKTKLSFVKANVLSREDALIFYLMWIQSCKMLKTNNNNSACQIKWRRTTYLQTPSWKSGLIFHGAHPHFDRHLSEEALSAVTDETDKHWGHRLRHRAVTQRNAPSSGAGCWGHWHGSAKSSFGRAGSCGTAGTGRKPSCSTAAE